jgi:hypothetical protein
LKDFADNNYRFDKNGREFNSRVENTVGIGEIAHYEQIFLFPHCFQKNCRGDTLKQGLVWERFKIKLHKIGHLVLDVDLVQIASNLDLILNLFCQTMCLVFGKRNSEIAIDGLIS